MIVVRPRDGSVASRVVAALPSPPVPSFPSGNGPSTVNSPVSRSTTTRTKWRFFIEVPLTLKFASQVEAPVRRRSRPSARGSRLVCFGAESGHPNATEFLILHHGRRLPRESRQQAEPSAELFAS